MSRQDMLQWINDALKVRYSDNFELCEIQNGEIMERRLCYYIVE